MPMHTTGGPAGTPRARVLRRIRSLLPVALLLAAACERGVADPVSRGRIVADVRGLTGAGLEAGVSVAATVTLSVNVLNQDITVFSGSVTLAPTDSIAEFDFEVPRGVYSFNTNVLSNNGVLLYAGSANSVSDRSPITIVPAAVNAVMVVSPAVAGINQPLIVRNPGSRPLFWSACVVVQTACSAGFLSPASDTLAPGGRQQIDPVRLPNGTWIMRFSSQVGTVDARKTI